MKLEGFISSYFVSLAAVTRREDRRDQRGLADGLAAGAVAAAGLGTHKAHVTPPRLPSAALFGVHAHSQAQRAFE